MNSKSFLGLSSALFAIFVWGISFVSTKIILRELPPVTIAFFRQFIAIIPLIILMIFKKENFRIRGTDVVFLTPVWNSPVFLFENRV